MIATTRYRSGVARIPEHIPVIFMSCRVDLLIFAEVFSFPKRARELHCIIGLCLRHFRYFLGADVSDN